MGNCFFVLGNRKAQLEEYDSSDLVDSRRQKQRFSIDRKKMNILGEDRRNVEDYFMLGATLGKGQFGVTKQATEIATGKKYACKAIAKRRLTSHEDIADVRREVQIMHHLAGHPNIVEMKDAFEDNSHVYLVGPPLSLTGAWMNRVMGVDHGNLEADAARLVRTMVRVVAHCHAMGVVHRDLKPENFLLSTRGADALLKCTDFGLSVFFSAEEKFADMVGSAFYVAPEVLKRSYGPNVDIWSCGVILYILLSGAPPFWGETEKQIFETVKEGKVEFCEEPWPSISSSAKDCIRRMLTIDPEQRATAKEILQHEWLKENGAASTTAINNAVVDRLKGFAAMNKLKKVALQVIAMNLPAQEIEGLRQLFESIDIDHSGTITKEELREGLRKKGIEIEEDDLHALMQAADVDGDGTIDYKEFLGATIHLNKLNKEEHLMKAFKHFDIHNSGYITKAGLVEGLEGMASVELEQIIGDVDKDNDGKIDYDEFCMMMLDKGETTNAVSTVLTKPSQR